MSILSESLKSAIYNRLLEFIGISLVMGAVFVLLSLYHYDLHDPSFNTFVDGQVTNKMGVLGAYLADILFQYIGVWQSLFIIFIFVQIGFYIIRHKNMRATLNRVFVGAFAAQGLVAAIIVLRQYLYNQEAWFGLFSNFIAYYIGYFVSNQNYPQIQYAIISGILLMSVVGVFYSLAISWDHWRNGCYKLIYYIVNVLAWAGSKLYLGIKVFVRVVFLVISYICNKVKARITYAVSGQPAPKRQVEKRVKQKQKEVILPLHQNTEGVYVLPEPQLLTDDDEKNVKTFVSKSDIDKNIAELDQVLQDFGIKGVIKKVKPGPVLTVYEFVPEPGIRLSRIISLSDDIARHMRAISTRISSIPGSESLGIEIPNERRKNVFLKTLLQDSQYTNCDYNLPLILGQDVSGEIVIKDLAKMPHLLVAGTTGSGKSVGVNAMILSLLYRFRPEECKFIMIDPKMLELSAYEDIPHLLTPVVTDSQKAVVALKWAVGEMENRYRAMSQMGVRNIDGYNQKIAKAKSMGQKLSRRVQTGFDGATGQPIFEEQELDTEILPYIIIIVDETADLMLTARKEVEAAVQRLAQMARAAGLHLIMATQRPSVDVITGTIKANFPTRISFQVASKMDSRTILNSEGAEKLLGRGDMLYVAGGVQSFRVHGPFVRDDDVSSVVAHLKSQGSPEYVDISVNATTSLDVSGKTNSNGGGQDEAFSKAVEVVRREQKASISYIQRQLKIGYNRAADIVEQMEKEGLISTPNHVGKREVLVPPLDK